MGEAPVKEDRTVTRSAEYVGSFPVDDLCLDDQIEQLHTQLKSLRASKRKRPVSLKFSIKGVKMYDEDETTLLMAHALRRVSLSTARPVDAQFAFVSHNPGSTDAQLYCHVFQARHSRAAQFLNLLLCRCFQLSYLEKHPEEAQEDSVGSTPRRNPSLLNHGFPLSVSALVSFRRAPFRGLLPGTKKSQKSSDEQHSSHDEVFPTSSPSLVRKKAIRTKGLRSGAYRSFTFTPLKQRIVQERLSETQEKDKDKKPSRRSRAPSLAETEEALAQTVWCWAGIATDSSYSLLADDVLGSYLLCPHPKKPKCGSVIIRFPCGLITHLIENTRKGKFVLEKCKKEFDSLAELIEHYTDTLDELPCLLSCARVNHCYEWEENISKQLAVKPHKSLNKAKTKSTHRKQWV
ncbi:SH2 domain-containing protein 5 isoform X1 [Centropristis striata]|uniref:SH2 domain-containing protein 5 isoform X1 n=1 Tax=Centropristis striata TaxID=184440 RepID=UPI0027E2172A|nr:SH2 domain-containing protein 5 isoform X1 [Centropristis striata]XP_059183608.1 SH2 domain-containing protein 5 isoform X1 [Centropristis striata]XP_059183617.1 SH2 domain-containing protein 5 isoform X1 [Centropristis striata]